MVWEFTIDRPIYLQLREHIKLAIVSGVYLPGGKLQAVRDLAVEAAVNPNTMQRALSELEREGLIYAQRTSGRFVTEDASVIEKAKSELAGEIVNGFLEKMKAIGYSTDEMVKLISAAGHKATAAHRATAKQRRTKQHRKETQLNANT